MTNELITLKSVVPLVIYVARLFVERLTLGGWSFVQETLTRFGPDLYCMALLLSVFNMVQADSGFRSFSNGNGSRSPEGVAFCFLVYVLVCLILWVVCLLCYQNMTKISSTTNRAKLRQAGHWAASFVVAFILFLGSVILQ